MDELVPDREHDAALRLCDIGGLIRRSGGVSLTGGIGTLVGAMLGILILTVLNNGLVLLNVFSFYHDIARGIVIIIAVYLDHRRRQGMLRKLSSDA